MTQVLITLTNGIDNYDLRFDLLPIGIADRWLKHLQYFIDAGQPWDDSLRFYNFPHGRYGHKETIQHLKHLVATIRDYSPDIIDRDIGETLSRDDLNYLHHIFERYHGLYDQQDNNEFFRNAPVPVQVALGDLNIWIHRYETLGGIPRFVATWKHKPYRDELLPEDYQHFSLHEEWGDLRLNYCEIGKNLYDLWHDDDQWISEDAFVPQRHYCFDFTVRFTDQSFQQHSEVEQRIWKYFAQHREFFAKLGYEKPTKRLSLGGITIAKLDQSAEQDEIFRQISQHQCLKTIQIDRA
jgi:hypothetical protein